MSFVLSPLVKILQNHDGNLLLLTTLLGHRKNHKTLQHMVFGSAHASRPGASTKQIRSKCNRHLDGRGSLVVIFRGGLN
jgi:hypothetical protein